MSQTKAQLVSGTTAQDLTVDNINTTSVNSGQVSGRKNLIINGAMKIGQRGSSFSFAHDGTTEAITLDRHKFKTSSLDEFDCTVSQDSTVPDGQGFSKSLKVLTGTAESSVGADERVELQYNFEGQDLQPLAYGVSGAKKIIVSFYVKSSITGTFGFSIYRNESTDRIVNKPYTINSANTWERKTIEIDGDTSAAITDDTSERARFVWFLLAGSNFTSGGAQSSYANYSAPSYAGGHAQNGVATTAGATWFITGIQVEVGGSVATDFEHRSFAEELRLCYRYHYHTGQFSTDTAYFDDAGGFGMAESTTKVVCAVRHPVEMRATPTITLFDSTDDSGKVTQKGHTHGIVAVANQSGQIGFQRVSHSGGGTQFQLDGTKPVSFGYKADAEL